MESFNLILYKWNMGVFKISDMIKLVQNSQITPQQFFEITRYDFQSIKKQGVTEQ